MQTIQYNSNSSKKRGKLEIMLPSVKCSRLCLCTRLLMESATVDFFLNLQKSQFGHSEHEARCEPFQLAIYIVTSVPLVFTNPLSSHYICKLEHIPHRPWSTWSSWDLSFVFCAQKSILIVEGDKEAFDSFCACMCVQNWEHCWLKDRWLQHNHH